MQRNDPGKRETLAARDFERPLGGGLAPVDAVIVVVKSDCPNEWARYCDLAHQLVQPKQPTDLSQEEPGRQHLAENGESVQQKTAEMSRMASFNGQLAGWPAEPLAEYEIILDETRRLELLFRERLASALESGRYFLTGFDRLSPINVSPILIKPEHFRFDSDEMELEDSIKLSGVRIVPNQTVSADPPGPKPGQQSAKDLACRAVLSILNDEAHRPPRGHGRLTKLARMVRIDLEGNTLNSIEKFIRGTVREWETKNPGK
jgi:hypothetical protein